MKTAALILFVLMYILMIVLPKYRTFYALGTAAVFLVFGILPIEKAAETVNWNVRGDSPHWGKR